MVVRNFWARRKLGILTLAGIAQRDAKLRAGFGSGCVGTPNGAARPSEHPQRII